MVIKCEICGTTENIQRHHISYEPEIIQLLCVNCHQKVHNHGVGNAPGWTTKLFEFLKIDIEILYKEGATNGEVAKAYNVSYVTASHWRKKLGLGLSRHIKKIEKTEGGKETRDKRRDKPAYIPDFVYDRELELFTIAREENTTKVTLISKMMEDLYNARTEAKA